MASTADGVGDKRGPARVLGDPMGGCRHCGAVIRTENEKGTIVIYRAAAECCPSALQDQIIYCHEEIDQVNARLAAQETNLLRLRDELPLTEGRVREDALNANCNEPRTTCPSSGPKRKLSSRRSATGYENSGPSRRSSDVTFACEQGRLLPRGGQVL